MVTDLSLPKTGTVPGMEKPGRWWSCGMSWCHQPLEMHLPTLELWAL